MYKYQMELFFTNLDDSLYTNEQASVTMNIKADNYQHADLLAERIRKVFGGDHFILEDLDLE